MVRVGWRQWREEGARKTWWRAKVQSRPGRETGNQSNPTTQTITFLAHYGINVWNTGAAMAPRIAPFFSPLFFLLSDNKKGLGSDRHPCRPLSSSDNLTPARLLPEGPTQWLNAHRKPEKKRIGVLPAGAHCGRGACR